jgi:hypothetical protein
MINRNIDHDEERKIIDALKESDNGARSMRVVGRGTLVMNAADVRNSQKFKNLLSKSDKILTKVVA